MELNLKSRSNLLELNKRRKWKMSITPANKHDTQLITKAFKELKWMVKNRCFRKLQRLSYRKWFAPSSNITNAAINWSMTNVEISGERHQMPPNGRNIMLPPEYDYDTFVQLTNNIQRHHSCSTPYDNDNINETMKQILTSLSIVKQITHWISTCTFHRFDPSHDRYRELRRELNCKTEWINQ